MEPLTSWQARRKHAISRDRVRASTGTLLERVCGRVVRVLSMRVTSEHDPHGITVPPGITVSPGVRAGQCNVNLLWDDFRHSKQHRRA